MSDDDWKGVSIIAVSSLSSVTSTATEVGHVEIALSSNHAQQLLLSILRMDDLEHVTDEMYENMKIALTRMSKQISAAEAPQTHAFKCLADSEQCWHSATTKTMKFFCLITFVACILPGFENFITIKIGE